MARRKHSLHPELFAVRESIRTGLSKLTWRWGPSFFYERSLDGLNALARGQTRFLQNGYLRFYLFTVLFAGTGLAGFTLFARDGFHWPQNVLEIRFYEAMLAVLILCGAFFATISRSRLGAVASLGVAGYGVSLIYLLFGAPDLAMTQFLIESLTVILFVLAFYHLPQFTQLSSRRTRLRDIFIALLAGGVMTTLVLSAVGIQLHESISPYFAQTALPLAHGRNIVNVILVDFRGIDTLGEITVLSIAAVGVYALLKLNLHTGKDEEGEDE
ncbi:MAG: DUF4040 domain-containing protein [Chloroflexi bacterium CFX2]|nr:DUF4040 domain-containing protein [Chloroflexi bacterium CFX2]